MSESATPKNPETRPSPTDNWERLVVATSSPLKLFALVVLICNTVFGIAATMLASPEVFVYAPHIFLAVVGAFALIALWNPRSFYSPSELVLLMKAMEESGQKDALLSKSNPLAATAVLVLNGVIYALYQGLHP